MTKFNKKPCFPYTYGDDIKNDDQRLSNYLINKLSNRRIQQYLGSLAVAIIALGGQAKPTNAIPPEYGEAAANVLQELPQQCVPGSNAKPRGIMQNQVDVNQLQQKAAEALGAQVPKVGTLNNIEAPKTPYVPFFPGPPSTTRWQVTNSVALILSIGVICANGAWGNPWAATVCAGALFKAAESLMSSMMK